MFFWIGVLVVSLAILYISYRLLRLVHLSSRKRHSIVWFVSITATIFIVTLIGGISLLMVLGVAIVGNPYAERSRSASDNLPLVSFEETDVEDLTNEYPDIQFEGLNRRIASLTYGFTDYTAARVYKVQHPNQLIQKLEEVSHKKRISSSLFYEKMLCGTGGDLIMQWSVSAENLQDYFAFCNTIFSNNVEITEIEYPINTDEIVWSIRRIGKTEFFVINEITF
ncbi:hypothetical protein [uncultured Psychrosphaera sp.]|uniref:hypothetical protein n=1 Tax=uncultured Psychrosphaera sp. TaxID=1403522 RepID=UPI0030F7552F